MSRRNKKVPEIDRGILAAISEINVDTPAAVFDMVFWIGWNAAIMETARANMDNCKFDAALETMSSAVSLSIDSAEKVAEDARGDR